MQVGQTVMAEYKTGLYIGELVGVGDATCKVRALAVLRHPAQGDLHHPMEADVAMFHERKALAFREVANVPSGKVKPYEGQVPDYMQSLAKAVEDEKARLNNMIRFAQRSLGALEAVKKEYGLSERRP